MAIVSLSLFAISTYLFVYVRFCYSSAQLGPTSGVIPENLLNNLSQLVSQSSLELEDFKKALKRSRESLEKYKSLSVSNFKFDNSIFGPKSSLSSGIKGVITGPSRFTQSASTEPVVADEIRSALYSTQPVSDPPQATVTVDASEDPVSVVKNAEEVATFSDDGTRDFFEEELYRMKRELGTTRRMDSLRNVAGVLSSEIGRLMVHKSGSSERVPEFIKSKPVESTSVLDCACCS
uniref:Unnamed protein product n=1 Tax=Babesia bovis TaxID=5865 RepID=S6BI49_BABBO|nr:unnamed protein product [Babesia bovis]